MTAYLYHHLPTNRTIIPHPEIVAIITASTSLLLHLASQTSLSLPTTRTSLSPALNRLLMLTPSSIMRSTLNNLTVMTKLTRRTDHTPHPHLLHLSALVLANVLPQPATTPIIISTPIVMFSTIAKTRLISSMFSRGCRMRTLWLVLRVFLIIMTATC